MTPFEIAALAIGLTFLLVYVIRLEVTPPARDHQEAPEAPAPAEQVAQAVEAVAEAVETAVAEAVEAVADAGPRRATGHVHRYRITSKQFIDGAALVTRQCRECGDTYQEETPVGSVG